MHARPARTSRRAICGSASCSSFSCAATALFCCFSSSFFCRILSRAMGLAFSRKEGVIFLSVLSSWLEIASSCLVSRCVSFSTSTVFSGTGMSTSRSSDTTVRTTPTGAAPRAANAPTWTCSASARASHATAERSASRAPWKPGSPHQRARATRSFGGMSCSALVFRICETSVHMRANQRSACSSRSMETLAGSIQGLIISDAGSARPDGSRCQTASVTNGMKGCNSVRETSRAYNKARWAMVPRALEGSPPRCGCKRVFATSTYHEAKSSCRNSFNAFVGGAKLLASSASVTFWTSPWAFEINALSGQGMARKSFSSKCMPTE
mmetsp:Transcript_71276/g.202091  ORF Transcript_71276/g.202091 Transcript_71276/m.202091 type:complete len:324 (-) Transcript_71276:2329-3300(-)